METIFKSKSSKSYQFNMEQVQKQRPNVAEIHTVYIDGTKVFGIDCKLKNGTFIVCPGWADRATKVIQYN